MIIRRTIDGSGTRVYERIGVAFLRNTVYLESLAAGEDHLLLRDSWPDAVGRDLGYWYIV
jgi:hypothetical protein